ncbi:hypothetical protein QBC47DRAFT_399878 [Echria macrotheca]|uniref:DUF7892 domain-containing protein n=1 Tax=Echria macrotheca TaxID=438768 RepID=A0AAJ0BFX8_9PEZI|nr:hypothetical protein QBC47DRAFT_399878 [Echria macrotheca]
MASTGDEVGPGGSAVSSLDPEQDCATTPDHKMESQAGTADALPEASHRAMAPAQDTQAHRKRKPEETDDESHNDPWSEEGSKRIKLTAGESHPPRVRICLDKSLLPPEVWHRVFTFCPPKALGNLLLVNKLFNLYLDPSSNFVRKVPSSIPNCAVASLEPNAIWRASRRLFWPQMPTPLRSQPEIDMWRLACSSRCQNCQKLPPQSTQISPGPKPGVDGVAVIWAFAMRICAPCLLKKSVKELDLLVSPSLPSAVLTALPFVHLTRELHIVPAAELEQLPQNQQTTKLFSLTDVKLLEQEFATVRNMGTGTVDEWLKGLENRGRDLRQQASKWEKWDSSGGVAKMVSELYPGYTSLCSRQPLNPINKTSTATAAVSAGTKPSVQSLPSLPRLPPPPTPHGRPDRSPEELARLKAARKSEIERRALELDPPLLANILRHMPSFQAALQIVAPLDDNGWDVLKPRLLAQRVEAELREEETAPKTNPVPELSNHHALEATLATTKEARELVDKDWEIVQAPLRSRIAGYADDIINDAWGGGNKVTKELCGKFAVDVLIYVRSHFYAHVARDAMVARNSGQQPAVDPPGGPFTQKLTLENMKWIFDIKVKPHTEPFRKELFYCSACEGNTKVFGFEGVIQHYAAKHTTSLSLGSIVVHWRAEWPAKPPFSANPRVARPSLQGQPPPPFASSMMVPSGGYSYSFSPGPAPLPPYPPPPIFAPPPFTDPYHSQAPALPYHQPSTYPPFSAPNFGQPLPYATHSPAPYAPYPPPPGPYPTGNIEPGPAYAPIHAPVHEPFPHTTQSPYTPAPPPHHAQTHNLKMEDIAKNSREVWQVLGNIKDLHGSTRLFVTIHHVAKRYRGRFHEIPPLALFIEGLAHHRDMRPVRNVNGLVCKACHLVPGNGVAVEQDKKTFSVPQLSNHFQAKHVVPMQSRGSSPLDWTVDMVMLGDEDQTLQLRPSISEYQKSLLKDALPGIFEPPIVSSTSTRHSQMPVAPPLRHDLEENYSRQDRSQPNKRATLEDRGAELLAAYDEPTASHSSSNHYPPKQPRQEIESLRARGSNSYAEAKPNDNHARAVSTISRTPKEVLSQHNGTSRISPEGQQPRIYRDSPQLHQNGNYMKEHHRQTRDNDGPEFEATGKYQSQSQQEWEEQRQRSTFRDVERAETETHRELQRVRAMWPTDREGTRTSSSPGGWDRSGTGSTPHAGHLIQFSDDSQQTFQQPAPRKPASIQEEPSLLGALERHLEEGGQSHATVGGRRNHEDSRTGTTAEMVGSRQYSKVENGPDRVRYERQYLPRDGQSPTARHIEPLYHSGQERAERQSPHGFYQQEFGIPREMHRRGEDDGYNRPLLRGGDYRSEQRQAPYYYRERSPSHARPAIDGPPMEAYEIVQIIDEQGEYFIRRPVRRGLHPRGPPRQDLEAHRADVYPEQDEYYSAGSAGEFASREPPVRRRPDFEPPVGHQAPAYHEGYDPRFP